MNLDPAIAADLDDEPAPAFRCGEDPAIDAIIEAARRAALAETADILRGLTTSLARAGLALEVDGLALRVVLSSLARHDPELGDAVGDVLSSFKARLDEIAMHRPERADVTAAGLAEIDALNRALGRHDGETVTPAARRARFKVIQGGAERRASSVSVRPLQAEDEAS